MGLRKSPKTSVESDFFDSGKKELDLLEKLETIREDKIENIRGNPQTGRNREVLLDEDKPKFSINDLTFAIINNSLMKFDPYIYGFHKELLHIQENLFDNNKKSADLLKRRYDQGKRLFFANYHLVELIDNVDKKQTFLKKLTKANLKNPEKY